MKNRFFLMRHAESWANRNGIIVSDPRDADDLRYGLTDDGVFQVFASVADLPLTFLAGKSGTLDISCVFAHGPFVRHAQTANIASQILKLRVSLSDPLTACESRLVRRDEARERFFGRLDRGSAAAYKGVWKRDAADPSHATDRVESVEAVRARMLALHADLEAAHDDSNIFIVSSGDPLQILEAALSGRPASSHRTLTNFEKAEIRRVMPDGSVRPIR